MKGVRIMNEKKGFVTIGYGDKDMKEFMQILNKYNVNYIVDVRSFPYSKYYPEYNKDVFEAQLIRKKISYKWLGHLLGGRPDESSAYDEDGTVDYVKLVKTKSFLKGLEQLEELILTNNVAVMCSEGDPIKCHRFLAISRELSKKEYIIAHIIKLDNYISQAKLQDNLVKLNFGECIQMTMLQDQGKQEGQDKQEDYYLDQSYLLQNKKYGYKRRK
jgi:uncharacterized protein (DUF488 family)